MASAQLITKTYSSIRGVDFSREARNIRDNRASLIVNMWKNYEDDSECLITREGYELVADVSDMIEPIDPLIDEDKTVYGIHVYSVSGTKVALLHVGTYLIMWENFPGDIEDNPRVLSTAMGTVRSSSFMFGEKLYINDGTDYVRFEYDNNTPVLTYLTGDNYSRIHTAMENISASTTDYDLDVPFVPITSISRTPVGAGEQYQPVNVLTPYRKNQFVGDGKTKVYMLDTNDIDGNRDVRVWINDTFIDKTNGTSIQYNVYDAVTGEMSTETTTFTFSVNDDEGSITFNNAPPAPDTIGADNVIILFSKTVAEHKSRIAKCDMNCIFDNRIFFSGNPDYKNGLFHSELNDPEYVSDIAYYQDGSDSEAITSIVPGGSVLWVFKESKDSDSNLFYHYAETKSNEISNAIGQKEYIYTKTYPSNHGKCSSGSFGGGINFLDDVCFLSKEGVYGLQYSKLDRDIYSDNFVCSRSRLINPKLINEEDYREASVQIYKGYLCILINGKMYLADSRSTFSSGKGYEYEWFYFNNLYASEEEVNGTTIKHYAVLLKTYDGVLYFGTDNGEICAFRKDRATDCDRDLENYVVLRSDNFDIVNHLKTTSKRGGIAKFKVMGNSAVSIYVRSTKSNAQNSDFKYVTNYKSSGFSFDSIDFRDLTFITDDRNYCVIKTKQKKFNELQIMLRGETQYEEGEEQVCRPFGFFSLTLEAFTGSYIKR